MVTGKAISIARTCPLAKDGLIRAGLRGGKTISEWEEGNQAGQIGPGSCASITDLESSYGHTALNPTRSRNAAASLCSTPSQKDCLGREDNWNGITTESKLKFALEVALLAALLTLSMGDRHCFHSSGGLESRCVHF